MAIFLNCEVIKNKFRLDLALRLTKDFICISPSKFAFWLFLILLTLGFPSVIPIISMSQSFSFQCFKCNEIHEGVPSFNFEAPALYYDIPETERENRTFLTSDACVIDDEYFFAKGFLLLPVAGLEETLTFTPWVSLSEDNFLKFQESLDIAHALQYEPMLGWFCNNIDGFGDCEGLKTNLIFQNNNNRPY